MPNDLLVRRDNSVLLTLSSVLGGPLCSTAAHDNDGRKLSLAPHDLRIDNG